MWTGPMMCPVHGRRRVWLLSALLVCWAGAGVCRWPVQLVGKASLSGPVGIGHLRRLCPPADVLPSRLTVWLDLSPGPRVRTGARIVPSHRDFSCVSCHVLLSVAVSQWVESDTDYYTITPGRYRASVAVSCCQWPCLSVSGVGLIITPTYRDDRTSVSVSCCQWPCLSVSEVGLISTPSHRDDRASVAVSCCQWPCISVSGVGNWLLHYHTGTLQQDVLPCPVVIGRVSQWVRSDRLLHHNTGTTGRQLPCPVVSGRLSQWVESDWLVHHHTGALQGVSCRVLLSVAVSVSEWSRTDYYTITLGRQDVSCLVQLSVDVSLSERSRTD